MTTITVVHFFMFTDGGVLRMKDEALLFVSDCEIISF